MSQTHYTSDANGNVTAILDPNGSTWSATYDARNQRTALKDPAPKTAGGTTLPVPVTSLGYDANGDLTRLTDANQQTSLYTYDAIGLPASRVLPATAAQPALSDRTWGITYDQAGNPVQQTEPGGVTVNSTYDNLGRLISQQATGGDASASRNLSYDLDGRITGAGGVAGQATTTDACSLLRQAQEAQPRSTTPTTATVA